MWNRDYSFVGGLFSVNTLGGRVKLSYKPAGMEQLLDGSWRFGTAKLVYKHGKWFLHIPCTKEINIPDSSDIINVAGVDLGVNFTAVAYSSDGRTIFFSGKEIKHKRARFKAVRQGLQKRQTPSARGKLKKIGSRENRWVQQWHGKSAGDRLNSYNNHAIRFSIHQFATIIDIKKQAAYLTACFDLAKNSPIAGSTSPR